MLLKYAMFSQMHHPLTLFAISISLLLSAGCSQVGVIKPDMTSDGPQTNLIQQQLLQFHRQWQGTPHQLGGNSHTGIDCSAYVQRAYRQLFDLDPGRSTKQQRLRGSPVRYHNIAAGDLVFFKSGLLSRHVGIYLGEGHFLHVSSKRGVTRSRLDKGYWRKRFHTARRLSRN